MTHPIEISGREDTLMGIMLLEVKGE